jgi:hypothetical protein
MRASVPDTFASNARVLPWPIRRRGIARGKLEFPSEGPAGQAMPSGLLQVGVETLGRARDQRRNCRWPVPR